MGVKAGLHWNANTTAACEKDAYIHVGKFVNCSAFAKAANRPYINILYVNSLLMYQQSTDSIRLFAECSSHSRILFASTQKYVYIEHSHRFRMPRSRLNTRIGELCSRLLWHNFFYSFSTCSTLIAVYWISLLWLMAWFVQACDIYKTVHTNFLNILMKYLEELWKIIERKIWNYFRKILGKHWEEYGEKLWKTLLKLVEKIVE